MRAPSEDSGPPPGFRRLRVMLALLVWFSAAWFGSWELNPNNAVRLFAAFSIVEDGDATIDEYDLVTIDKSRFGQHLYLDKAPGMTILALPVVAGFALFSDDRVRAHAKSFFDYGFASFVRQRLRVAAALGPALLTALAAAMLMTLALRITGSVPAALFAALGYALGTPAWGWSTTVIGHAPVAALYVIAVCAWSAALEGRRAIANAMLTGAALGLAVAIEYQAVIAGTAIALWAAWRVWPDPRRWRLLASAVGPGIVGVALIAVYNFAVFGTIFRINYQGVVGWSGMDRGLFGLGFPDPQVLWAILFGTQRGLLWVAPVLLLAPLGLATMAEHRPYRHLAVLIVVVTVIVLLVNAGYVYWDGGASTGPRHAIPLVGLLSLGLAGAWVAIRSAAWRATLAALLALSIGLNAIIASGEIFAQPTYHYGIAASWARFHAGMITSIGNEWLGMTRWQAFILWATVAVVTIGWLADSAWRMERRTNDAI